MSFPDDSFDCETRSLMTRALDEAWRDVRAMLIAEPLTQPACATSSPLGSRPRREMASAIPISSS